MSLHIGTGGFPALAKDSPGAVPNVMASFNAGYALTDWLFSGHFARFPRAEDLPGRVAARMDPLRAVPGRLRVARRCAARASATSTRAPCREPPSFYFGRNVWCTFFRDPVGLQMLDQIGVDRVLYETDYPHTDTSWPDCLEVGDEMTSHLSADGAPSGSLAGNARDLFRIEADQLDRPSLSGR